MHRLTATGELSGATVPILERAFDDLYHERDVERIVVDVTELSAIDSTGMRALLALSTACAHAVPLRVVDGKLIERTTGLIGVDHLPPITG